MMSVTESRRIENLSILILMAAILCGAYAVYRPGLGGPFLFDDNLTIRSNQHLAMSSLSLPALLEAALSGDSGLLGRPLSMVTFALNRYAAGLQPHAFKVTNLVIHMANGVAVFVFSLLVLTAYRRRYDATLPALHVKVLSAAASAAWLLHPLNLSSVLYIAQRMNELAALFTLGGLICYLWGRLRMDDGNTGLPLMVAGVVVFGPLAVLSKENGALLPLFMLVLEAVLFRFATPTPGGRRALTVFFAVTVAVPAAALAASLLIVPDWALNGYQSRDFSLSERLMTEARVVWQYLYWTLVPLPGSLGFFHDDVAVSRGLTAPWSTTLAIAGHGALLTGAVLARRRAPLLTLAVLFFYAGHVMESTLFPLELVYEHRNYLPMVPVVLAAVYYLYRLACAVGRYRPVVYTAMFVLVLALGYITAVRAGEWSTLGRFAALQLRHHPQSPRANYMVGWLFYTRMVSDPRYRESHFENARRYFSRATLADKHYAGGLFGLVIAYQTVGQPLPTGIIAMLGQRLATTPFTSNDANWLRQLVMCQAKGPCRLPSDMVLSLMKAALANPTNAAVNKAYVLNIESRYLAALGEYPGAIRLVDQAAALVPRDLDYRLDAVDLLITAGRYDQARRALDEIRRLDTLGAYASGIADQARRLPESR
jgi:tetratricopeptide (TPR) repeat protein